MKNKINKKVTLVITALSMVAIIITINGCKASQAVLSKSGAQLWGENCRRCHNAPDPNTFSSNAGCRDRPNIAYRIHDHRHRGLRRRRVDE